MSDRAVESRSRVSDIVSILALLIMLVWVYITA
jgi:hypothetical protein